MANGRLVQLTGSDTNVRLYAGTILDNTVTDQKAAFNSMVMVFNGASSVLNFNGTETTGNLGSNNGTGVRLGAQGSGTGGSFMAMDVAEVCAFNSALSPTNRTNMYNYLKARWGTP